MRLSIKAEQLGRLTAELRRAGRREIGGVLVGEHRGGDDFALVDLSVQRRGGGHAHFQRDPAMAARFVEEAITRTGGEAKRVNYLGEWHSHPSFSASPSVTDMMQMQAIVDDPNEAATFAVLVIVSPRRTGLEMSATLFLGGGRAEAVDVEIIGAAPGAAWSMAPSEPSEDEENDNEGRPHPAPFDAEGKDAWRRSRTDSTLRQWWRQWLDNVW